MADQTERVGVALLCVCERDRLIAKSLLHTKTLAKHLAPHQSEIIRLNTKYLIRNRSNIELRVG